METARQSAAERVERAERASHTSGNEPPTHPDPADLLAAKLRARELSARGLHKAGRVARTVADLKSDEQVGYAHVADALSLRTGRATVVP